MDEGGDRDPGAFGPWTVTAIVLLAVAAVIAMLKLTAPRSGRTSFLVELGLLVAVPGAALSLRWLGLGEPVVRRPGWRWLGAGSLLYFLGGLWAFQVLVSLGGVSPWWEDLVLEALGLGVIVGAPLAFGPEIAGERR